MSHPFDEFGSHLFSKQVMQEYLPMPIYRKWRDSVDQETAIDKECADAIAHGMKVWALSLGATHFSHWFQPMNGITAEKHDSFLEVGVLGKPLIHFSGQALIQGETDGSSFPNGGLRTTFEARGYTYWDITSFAFVREHVLFIPSIFISYTGEPLDQKAPLLKAMDALNDEATKTYNHLSTVPTKAVHTMIGLEQEYFLVDKKYYEMRPDLVFTGRTLLGRKELKGQEFEDHYFGVIPDRVRSFMEEVNKECWRLGIFTKVEHNEAAPSQYEISVIYNKANVAVDENMLLMDILKKVARRHDLVCLLNEKPFKSVNGSGKHTNFSIINDEHENLVAPKKNSAENFRYLAFICAFMKAVDEHSGLLRLMSSDASNDHRLGAAEAPPAIISIFMGEPLENLLLELEKSIELPENRFNILYSPLKTLQQIPSENTDRNRTSPIAYTGNKFEFRMLGSSLNPSPLIMSICTMFASSLKELNAVLDCSDNKRQDALLWCQSVIKKHKRVMFSGDGYSDNWVDEASRRGLPNYKNFIDSLCVLEDESTIDLFERMNVLSEGEIDARHSIYIDNYIQMISTEIRTFSYMVNNYLLPKATSFVNEVLINEQIQYVKFTKMRLINLMNSVFEMQEILSELFEQALEEDDKFNIAMHLQKNARERMYAMRSYCDQIEELLPHSYYPFPTYDELLYN